MVGIIEAELLCGEGGRFAPYIRSFAKENASRFLLRRSLHELRSIFAAQKDRRSISDTYQN